MSRAKIRSECPHGRPLDRFVNPRVLVRGALAEESENLTRVLENMHLRVRTTSKLGYLLPQLRKFRCILPLMDQGVVDSLLLAMLSKVIPQEAFGLECAVSVGWPPNRGRLDIARNMSGGVRI